MKAKIAIAGGILLVGAILFLPQTLDLFPDAPELVTSLKNDMYDVQRDTVDGIQSGVDSSIEFTNEKVQELQESSKDILSTQGLAGG